ncbi:MAG: tRNA uridine-5-carboxymethylaminomethyl(34) synthesis GTPase MnmE [Janthinobacterium lividum]
MSIPDDLPADTTIVAVATPPGRGGIGVVRLSGPQALHIAAALFSDQEAFRPRIAHYRILYTRDGQRMDDAVVTWFASPHSYTGQDVVEIATHGSPVLLDWLVKACIQHGAEPARPGEFTERAFLSGRLDLTGAEAVRDLIEAQTLGQTRQAAEQMGGSIAKAIRPTKQALLELIALLEAGIDFAEDDLDTVSSPDLATKVAMLRPPLDALLATFTHGRLLREGLRLAIVGEPNVGKSSLFNRLVEQERAIVTAIPGTTRDVIAERISLEGIPIELLDTAGLRETDDEAERIGVSRSREAMAEADAVLIVLDASLPAAQDPWDDPAYSAIAGRPVLVVLNKIDLQKGAGNPRWDAQPDTASYAKKPWPIVSTSATTGHGMLHLKDSLLTLVRGKAATTSSATLTNLRQRTAVQAANAALEKAALAIDESMPHEFVLLDLYESLHALDELTGQTTPDDVLNLIFSAFCIGK